MRMHSSVCSITTSMPVCLCIPLPVVCLIRQPLSSAILLYAILLALGHAWMLDYTGHARIYWAYWPLGMLDTRAHLFVLLAATTDKFPYKELARSHRYKYKYKYGSDTDITSRQIPIDGSVQSENKGGISTSYGWPQHNTSEGSVDVLLRLWWQNSAEEYDDEDDHKVRGPKNSQKSVNHWISWGKKHNFSGSCKL